jgi:transcriptional regulator with XRE-family HTH domain
VNGTDLKAIRRARRWRQRDLAEYLGVDQPTVSEMERDVRDVSAEVAARLSELPAPEAAAASHEEGVTPSPPSDTSTGDGEPVAAPATPGGGDVPPRGARPPKEKATVVAPENLATLEVRVLKLIQGEDISIAVADPGETTVRYATQHIPGVADVVGMLDEYDGAIISANAVAMSKAWVKLARENARVRRLLEMLTAGGAWRDVFAATAPVVVAILLHHGMLPSLPGLTLAPEPGPEYDAANDQRGGTPIAGFPGFSETATGTVG